MRGVPYFMNIPLLGYIFRDTRYDSREHGADGHRHPAAGRTPLPPGTELALPTDRGPITYDEMKTQYDPAEVTRPRVPKVLYNPMPPW